MTPVSLIDINASVTLSKIVSTGVAVAIDCVIVASIFS